MTTARPRWWNTFASRRGAHADRGPDPHEGMDEQVRAVEDAVGQLRKLLRDERGRLRPDTWTIASTMVERTAELLPRWAETATQRAADALEVEDVVCRHLPRRVEAFLAIPDSQKPASADELLAQLEELQRGHAAAVRRLHALTRIRLEALRDVRRPDGRGA
ncbi:hypothetical protein ACL90Y_11875 [Micrococcus luteus]